MSTIAEQELKDWLRNRYNTLFKKFRSLYFTLDEAVNILNEKHKDNKENVHVILSELRKSGWLVTELDDKDARKRHYKLKSIAEAIKEVLPEGGSINRGELETMLKKAADLIRTRVDYKFILILLFLKRVSDKWQLEFAKAKKDALKDGLSEKDAVAEAKNAAYHDFDIPQEYLWENIRKTVAEFPALFSKALKEVAKRNPELKDVVDHADFIQFANSRDNAEILRQLVELFSEKRLDHVSPDVIGDAYEWLIRYFASQKAKEGEIYTPREVTKLLVSILNPTANKSVYDPASGSGGMLIASYDYVKRNSSEKEARKLFLFGQEANPQILALCRMNLYIHDIRDVNLAVGDTLLYPYFKDGDKLKQFDLVIANPPWNQDGYDETRLKSADFLKQRFNLGMVPRQSADWLWIQHMLTTAKEKVGVVIDNGCLFRSGKEKAIRQAVIDNDLIDCVILLPEKFFYNTGAPEAVLILNKNKPTSRKDNILFINASNEFEQHPEIRKLNRLSEKNIEKIVKAYTKFEKTKGFSDTISREKIKEQEYNLNVTLYVFPEAEEEDIDIKKEWNELQETESQAFGLGKKIEGYLQELEILKDTSQNQAPSLEKIKSMLREKLPELKKKHKVKTIKIFGSFVRGEQTSASDLDLLVEFDGAIGLFDFIGIEQDLSEYLGVKVDLVEKEGLKARLKDNILSEAQPL